MKSNKHIVFITPGFAQDEQDTLCTPYLQDYFQALQLARPDVRISIVALQYPYRRGQYAWRGIEVHALGGRNRRLSKPWIWQRCQSLLRRLHRQQPIDLLHAFWLGEASSCALQFGKTHSIPVFATLMGQDASAQNRYLRRLDFGGMTTIALSPFSDGLLARSVGRKADRIIPFGIAEGDVDRNGAADRPIDVLGVASLIPVKRIDRFLRVVAMLREQFPQLRAMLIGDGPEQQHIRAMIQRFDLQNHLEWVDFLPRPQILARMSESKVFLHTSKIEGMGLVLAEALARGCHLVSTPVGIAEESDKCKLSAHTYGLMEHTAHFLQNPVDFLPRVPFPIGDTVRRHLDAYHIDG